MVLFSVCVISDGLCELNVDFRHYKCIVQPHQSPFCALPSQLSTFGPELWKPSSVSLSLPSRSVVGPPWCLFLFPLAATICRPQGEVRWQNKDCGVSPAGVEYECLHARSPILCFITLAESCQSWVHTEISWSGADAVFMDSVQLDGEALKGSAQQKPS